MNKSKLQDSLSCPKLLDECDINHDKAIVKAYSNGCIVSDETDDIPCVVLFLRDNDKIYSIALDGKSV